MINKDKTEEIEELKRQIEAQAEIIQAIMQGRPLTTARIAKVSPEIRFWWYADKKESGCWEWTGAMCRRYGRFSVNGKSYKANRYALYLRTGEMPEDRWACHTCDNPKCVNPDHLYWGTAKQNTDDRYARGRGVLGEQHHAYGRGIIRKSDGLPARCKHSIETIRDVKSRIVAGETNKSISMATGIHKDTVSKVRKGKQWAKI